MSTFALAPVSGPVQRVSLLVVLHGAPASSVPIVTLTVSAID